MNPIALKMLTGDRAKYIGIVIGLTIASFLITQQLAIFFGLMTRTTSLGGDTDLAYPDIWVMDPKVQFIDDIKRRCRIRNFSAFAGLRVEWAVPLYKGLLNGRGWTTETFKPAT